MINDQQKTIRELQQKLDKYKQEMQNTKSQMAEELRQVRGHLDTVLKCPAMTISAQTSPQTSYAGIARTPPTSQPSNVCTLSSMNSKPSAYIDTLFCTIDMSRVSKEEGDKITAGTVRSAVEREMRTSNDATMRLAPEKVRSGSADSAGIDKISIAMRLSRGYAV
ncbi:hypothetical protein FOVG_17725 [Fusarium oxysporum f. sp. pisi HDV247]|uniref:Uncharacterized protein n=1 Tax=Fusarium oxysporum f. sp. pisi HDV247 TaxID=1080344 RepID=W9NDW5_FUSOX|nr:hypothetical protein FOVG_17725 [Fusarium oxysporum f. sp. pisi HDV247]